METNKQSPRDMLDDDVLDDDVLDDDVLHHVLFPLFSFERWLMARCVSRKWLHWSKENKRFQLVLTSLPKVPVYHRFWIKDCIGDDTKYLFLKENWKLHINAHNVLRQPCWSKINRIGNKLDRLTFPGVVLPSVINDEIHLNSGHYSSDYQLKLMSHWWHLLHVLTDWFEEETQHICPPKLKFRPHVSISIMNLACIFPSIHGIVNQSLK